MLIQPYVCHESALCTAHAALTTCGPFPPAETGDVRDDGSEVFQFERGIRCHENAPV